MGRLLRYAALIGLVLAASLAFNRYGPHDGRNLPPELCCTNGAAAANN